MRAGFREFFRVSQRRPQELYLQHREYNAVAGAVAVMAALAAKLIWFRGG